MFCCIQSRKNRFHNLENNKHLIKFHFLSLIHYYKINLFMTKDVLTRDGTDCRSKFCRYLQTVVVFIHDLAGR